jgi:hypothetical protein
MDPLDGMEDSLPMRTAPAFLELHRLKANETLPMMRRDTQLWLAGSMIVAVGLGSFVVLHQRDELSREKMALEQQKLQANELKNHRVEDERLRRQEDAYALQIKTLDAEQARNAATASANQANQAASEQQAQDRQKLEEQIQELKTQRAKLAHQVDCTQTQSRMRLAEKAGDIDQAKALQERWNANCAS